MSRVLRLSLCLALLAVSWPAGAVERIVEIRVNQPVLPVLNPKASIDIGITDLRTQALPQQLGPTALPILPDAAVEQPVAAPEIAAVLPQARFGAPSADKNSIETSGPESAANAPDAAAGWVESSRRFDNAAKAPPAAVVLGAALPIAALGAAPLVHAFHAAAPFVNTLSYDAANVLSVAFPLPMAYDAFRRGNAKDFPLGRAILGAVGTLALGLVNATVLGKPLWGVMHAFIALGMLAPYVIGKSLEKRGGLKAYEPPQNLAGASRLRLLADKVLHDPAIRATAIAGAAMLALSAGLYAGAAAFVPAFLAAHLGAAAVAKLLLGIQIAKGALFVAVFAPDVAALVRGQPTHGFSRSFTTIYLGSVAAFTAWGFLQAAASPAGAIRDQYLIHGARNLAEAVASALSLFAISRAQARARSKKAA